MIEIPDEIYPNGNKIFFFMIFLIIGKILLWDFFKHKKIFFCKRKEPEKKTNI